MILDHIGELPEVREYLEWKGAHRMADAALAAADAELAAVGSDLQDEVEYTIRLRERAEKAEAKVERLKVCGNCNHCEMDCGCEFGVGTVMCEPCFYSPSRWKERKSASIAVTPAPQAGVAP